MVDEGKSMRLANLVLDGKQQAEHQLRDVAHGCADIADDHDFWFEGVVAVVDLDRDRPMFLIGPQRSL